MKTDTQLINYLQSQISKHLGKPATGKQAQTTQDVSNYSQSSASTPSASSVADYTGQNSAGAIGSLLSGVGSIASML